MPQVVGGLLVEALAQTRIAQAGERAGFTYLVAELPEDVQRPAQVSGRLPGATQQEVDEAQVGQCAGFTRLVPDLAVERQGLLEVTRGLRVAALPGRYMTPRLFRASASPARSPTCRAARPARVWMAAASG